MIIAVLAAAALAAGESPAPRVEALTLEGALQEASSRNLDLRAARARLAQAQVVSRKALAGYLPQVSVGGSYTYNNQAISLPFVTGYHIRNFMVPTSDPNDPERPAGIDNPPGLPTTFAMVPAGVEEIEIQKQHQFGGQAQLSQALLVPSLWAAMANASLAASLAELSVENARREILFAVAQLYYGAAGLREALEVQQRLLEVSREHEKVARLQFEVGAVPEIVSLRAQIELARTEQDVRRAELGYASAKSALAALLHREPDFEVVRPPAPPEPAGEDLVAGASRERPDLKAAWKSFELAQGTRRGVLASYAPTLALIGRYNLANVGGFANQNATWTLGVGLNWTLWDGGLREAELREAGERIEENLALALAAENRARDEVRRALLDLESARANRAKSEEQVRLARRNAELVKSSFEAGAATYLEVVDAHAALTGAELARVSETLNADLSVLKLARAAGLFDPK